MNAVLKMCSRLDRATVPGRRHFVGLLIGLAAVMALLPRSLSGRPRRDLSLHEADFYQPHKPEC